MREKEVDQMRYGCCVNMLARDEFRVGYDWINILPALGFDYVDLPIAQMMDMDEPAFAEKIARPLRDSCIPCVCVNNLFPASVRLTGENADFGAALDYIRRALERAARLGACKAVFGSSGARNVPFGFPHAEAEKQLCEILHRICVPAREYGITYVIEPLNKLESNILNGIAESQALCEAADEPQVRMLVDTYHMALCGETAQDVLRTRGSLRHVHLARPLGRGMPTPGDGEDYASFFASLRAIGYDGDISIEAYAPSDPENELRSALEYLKKTEKSI